MHSGRNSRTEPIEFAKRGRIDWHSESQAGNPNSRLALLMLDLNIGCRDKWLVLSQDAECDENNR